MCIYNFSIFFSSKKKGIFIKNQEKIMSHCEKVDGMKIPDKETDGYVFNHIMLRIKDPDP